MKRKIKTFRTRIRRIGNLYYPQIKGLLFWCYIKNNLLYWDQQNVPGYLRETQAQEQIEDFIRSECRNKERTKKEKKKKNVIPERIMTFNCNTQSFVEP